jgi:Tetratricopeptide repeat
VLSQASPSSQPDRQLTVRALLDGIASRRDQATGRPPLVEASIQQMLGSVYTELGDYAKAVGHFETALGIQREHLSESHEETLRSLNGLAMARWWGGDPSLAEPLARQGLETSLRVLGKTNSLTLQFMQLRASTMVYTGTMPWADIEPLFHQAWEQHSKVLGPDDPATLSLIFQLSLGYCFNFRPEKGAPLVAEALRARLKKKRAEIP